jgi:hypothetical protein
MTDRARVRASPHCGATIFATGMNSEETLTREEH